MDPALSGFYPLRMFACCSQFHWSRLCMWFEKDPTFLIEGGDPHMEAPSQHFIFCVYNLVCSGFTLPTFPFSLQSFLLRFQQSLRKLHQAISTKQITLLYNPPKKNSITMGPCSSCNCCSGACTDNCKCSSCGVRLILSSFP